jgi:hypothetical protein
VRTPRKRERKVARRPKTTQQDMQKAISHGAIPGILAGPSSPGKKGCLERFAVLMTA